MFKLVDSVKQIAVPNVGEHYPIYTGSEYAKMYKKVEFTLSDGLSYAPVLLPWFPWLSDLETQTRVYILPLRLSGF